MKCIIAASASINALFLIVIIYDVVSNAKTNTLMVLGCLSDSVRAVHQKNMIKRTNARETDFRVGSKHSRLFPGDLIY